MEPLRHDDPGRLGPYVLLSRSDSEGDETPAGDRRFIAKTADGGRAVVVTAPGAQADVHRFLAEAEQARVLSDRHIPWLALVTEVSSTHAVPWYASPFVPGLPLSEALAAGGGPLPERTVRALGSALAECLERLHAEGHAHAGLSPRAVLVAGSGPRLTAFSAVRAAGPDGQPRNELPQLEPAFLPPEQASGGRPRPPGDVYALGAVLAYAATGHSGRRPALDGAPAALAEAIRPCLEADPANRPSAADLLKQLLDGGRTPSSEAVPSTVVDGRTSRAAAMLGAGWLPHGVSAALADQSARVLDAEIPEEHRVPQEPQVPAASPGAAATVVTRTRRPTGRRTLVTGLAAGMAGLALGGTATWAATAEKPAEPTAAQRLAAKRRSRERLAGAPPNPRWHTRLDLPSAPRHAPVIWENKIAVIPGGSTVLGLDLATGDEAWRREGLHPSGPAALAEGGLVLIPGTDLFALDPRTGETRWRSRNSRPQLLGADGGTVWVFDGEGHIVAYDVARRRRLWRAPAPGGMSKDAGGHLLSDALVVRSPGPGRKSIEATGYSRRSGEEMWSRTYEDAFVAQEQATVSEEGTLLVAAEDRLKAYDLKRSGRKPRWTLRTPEPDDFFTGPPGRPYFGRPLVRGSTVFIVDGLYTVRAIDLRDGAQRWRAMPRFAYGNDAAKTGPPVVELSPSGRALLSVNSSEVAAYDAEEGTPRWRFTHVKRGADSALQRRRVAVTDSAVLVVGGKDAYFLPLK